MKLLLDENLSRRLVPFLQECYPGSSQVALLHGAPPHVVAIKGGNASKAAVLNLLLNHAAAIVEAIEQDRRPCVELIGPR